MTIINDVKVIVDAYLLILISRIFFLQVEVSVALSPVHNPAHILGSPAIPNSGIPTIPTIPNHGIPTIPNPNPSPPKTHPPSHPTHTVAPSCSDSLLVEVVTNTNHHHPPSYHQHHPPSPFFHHYPYLISVNFWAPTHYLDM